MLDHVKFWFFSILSFLAEQEAQSAQKQTPTKGMWMELGSVYRVELF